MSERLSFASPGSPSADTGSPSKLEVLSPLCPVVGQNRDIVVT
jgi:hypothetical protein